MSELARSSVIASRPTAGELARSASILALGSVASRALGLARETLIAHRFGATGPVSAFRLASRVPIMIYDLLIGGMLSAALVPVLSDYARPERRCELWPAASAVLSLLGALLTSLVITLELFAPQVAWLLGGGFDAELLAVLIRSLRILVPAVFFLGMAGGVTSVLYALQRFTAPAFSGVMFNLGIVVAVLVLAGRLDVYSISTGVLLGSLGQLAIQIPALRGAQLRFVLGWQHPAVQRVVRLYLPIALGMVISQIQVTIDGNLASRTGPQSVAWMQNATTLIQFPHGLVAVAISLASLPSLSQLAAAANWGDYRRTLGRALRLLVYLIVPAAVGLWVLATPIVRLIFEHGAFQPADTAAVVAALRLYLLGLIFAAVDWPLNYAFYARQDTLTPAVVGVVSVGVYLAVALALLQPMGYLGLVLADSAKHFAHALTMGVLLRRQVGGLDGEGLGRTAFRSAIAAVLMGLMAWQVSLRLGAWLPVGTLVGELAVVVITAGLAVGVYGLVTTALRMEEAQLVWGEITDQLTKAFRLGTGGDQ
ncbi:MAG: murein biosynthesis integral membrane protein MurJ [Anaerolineae bacterium]|nr:murein biosynthesis integral membrane protein MurJ [Anaerolineae bacterium]MDW8100912.1 murein biosynthesis integral membrane protein MurJ [Anaerolineae bacterium]